MIPRTIIDWLQDQVKRGTTVRFKPDNSWLTQDEFHQGMLVERDGHHLLDTFNSNRVWAECEKLKLIAFSRRTGQLMCRVPSWDKLTAFLRMVSPSPPNETKQPTLYGRPIIFTEKLP